MRREAQRSQKVTLQTAPKARRLCREVRTSTHPYQSTSTMFPFKASSVKKPSALSSSSLNSEGAPLEARKGFKVLIFIPKWEQTVFDGFGAKLNFARDS